MPILVSWAKAGISHKTYKELNKLIGYKDGKNQSIGKMLGYISQILDRLSELTGINIPTPNSLVCNSKTGLPSEGFEFVKESYKDMPIDKKEKYVQRLNSEAINYKNWDWVMAQLGLKKIITLEQENTIRKWEFFGKGGESEAHKTLKEHIAQHPEIVGAIEKGSNEHMLLSCDRLDVWFPESHIAVEVKAMSSPHEDIMRGLYQCVKYKALLDAESAVHGEIPDAKVYLIIEGHLNPVNDEIMKTLGINVIQNFKIPS